MPTVMDWINNSRITMQGLRPGILGKGPLLPSLPQVQARLQSLVSAIRPGPSKSSMMGLMKPSLSGGPFRPAGPAGTSSLAGGLNSLPSGFRAMAVPSAPVTIFADSSGYRSV